MKAGAVKKNMLMSRVALFIALAALLTSFLVGTYGTIAAIKVICAGLFSLQKRKSLRIFGFLWVVLYPFCVQCVAYVVAISLLAVAPDNFPVPGWRDNFYIHPSWRIPGFES